MRGECVGVEYKVAVCKGVVFEGEDQYNPTKEPLLCVTGSKDKIHGLNNLFCIIEGLLGTL